MTPTQKAVARNKANAQARKETETTMTAYYIEADLPLGHGAGMERVRAAIQDLSNMMKKVNPSMDVRAVYLPGEVFGKSAAPHKVGMAIWNVEAGIAEPGLISHVLSEACNKQFRMDRFESAWGVVKKMRDIHASVCAAMEAIKKAQREAELEAAREHYKQEREKELAGKTEEHGAEVRGQAEPEPPQVLEEATATAERNAEGPIARPQAEDGALTWTATGKMGARMGVPARLEQKTCPMAKRVARRRQKHNAKTVSAEDHHQETKGCSGPDGARTRGP